MRDRLDDFADAEIAVVFFDGTDRLAEYRTRFAVPDRIRLLADPDRAAYAALGIGRGPWWRVWRPRTWLAYLRLIRGGADYHRHMGDSLQLGGDVVIGRDGRIRALVRPADPDSRPAVGELVGALD